MKLSKRAMLTGGAGLAALGLIGGGAAVYYAKAGNGSEGKALRRLATGAMARLQVADAPFAVPEHPFLAPDGSRTRLADFAGEVVVLNVWAMWCAPCKEEMPTLAALAGSLEGTGARVVTVNVDHDAAQQAAAVGFLKNNAPLPHYRDPRFQLPFELPGKGGMPQTVLIDRQGRIHAWLTGGADWASNEAKVLVRSLLDV